MKAEGARSKSGSADETGQTGRAPSKRRDLPPRCLDFAVRIVALVKALPAATDGFVLGKQVCRSGTSIGANVEEAQASQTKREFLRRMSIARAEARETHYWLRLIQRCELVQPARLVGLLTEADELQRILTTIVLNAEKSEGRG